MRSGLGQGLYSTNSEDERLAMLRDLRHRLERYLSRYADYCVGGRCKPLTDAFQYIRGQLGEEVL
jgi:hypothetical protein